MPVLVSEENFKTYGASSSPTLVLVDRKGIVRLYHPARCRTGFGIGDPVDPSD